MATSKKIAINTLFMIPNQTGGTEYHLRSSLSYLEQLDRHHDFVVFCNQQNFNSWHFKSSRWQKICCPISGKNKLRRVLYEQLILPQQIADHDCKVVHSFGYSGLLFSKATQVVTVHDANWIDHPEDMKFLQRQVVKALTEQSMKKASIVATDSIFSSRQLKKHFPHLSKKIIVIEPGIDDRFQVLLMNVKTPLVTQKYFLSINAFYPHKKTLYLLALWQKFTQLHPEFKLVLVGQHGLDEGQVLTKLASLKNVQYWPKVSLPQLAALYKFAQACLMPSIYEGFGYPVYEAVAANKQVLVGNAQLYQSQVQPWLHELSFKLFQDCQLLDNFCRRTALPARKSSGAAPPGLSYEPGIQKLIAIYERLLNSAEL